MNTLLTILLIAAAIAALVALIRGIVAFLKTTEADLKSEGRGPSVGQAKQNKAMFARITFQALAVIIAVVLIWANR